MTISEKKRESLPASEMGLPGQDKYPVDTRKRAANAKARASQQYNKGNLSEAEKEKIDRKADKKLGEDKPKGKKDPPKKEYPLPPSRFQKRDTDGNGDKY